MAQGSIQESAVHVTAAPFVAHHAAEAPRRRTFRAAFAIMAASLLAVATIAVLVRGPSASELISSETMKPWEDGMYPSGAVFPAGYHFGNNNVFGKRSVFGAGDSFGHDNVFGEGSVFGAGDKFADDNDFGEGEKFGAGSEMGDKETVGSGSSFAAGTMIGSFNQFGKSVHFDRRNTIGRHNMFGPLDEFGRNTQLGAFNDFGPGSSFGSRVMFGKEQQFGAESTWTNPTYLRGRDVFGRHDYGLDKKSLPASDKEAWNWQKQQDPAFVPERRILDKVLVLKQEDDKRQEEGPEEDSKQQRLVAATDNAKATADKMSDALASFSKELAEGRMRERSD